MSKINVDTSGVMRAAKSISSYNKAIRSDFSAVESSVKSLNASWDGKASDKAIQAFFKIKDGYSEPRYTVMNNYVKYLNEQVVTGYKETEKVNKSLADFFK
ncbi:MULTISPECIES: WXG100 family type VII secretion target [Sutcliffiella]|uniref:WXG100 family type VII secretion target n=1 Tax=Sutcliffiella TaxID=2837511 RepID=UPI0022DDE10B|nr:MULTISPECIES: WXG100 family type VII secretion target [Sutcliffiella]MED4014538.1 WXG100 family type VII secretion target [Sutcliffiella cohnii]WBL14607.1 WXG100 family type VII secretion target [Sutcliffiella sp. NC1]